MHNFLLSIVIFLGLLTACTSANLQTEIPATKIPSTETLIPTFTYLPTLTPSPTLTPTLTQTLTLTPTSTFTSTPTLTKTLVPTNTPKPIFRLGSPFGSCGDGVARIWSNDSFNGVAPNNYDSKVDQHHGHVDIMRPVGCYSIVVYSPVDGYLKKIDNNIYELILDIGLHLGLNPNNPPEFINVLNFDLVSGYDLQIIINMGHFSATVAEGHITKGEAIGNLVMEMGHWKIAYQVITIQNYIYKIWSPTLLLWDTQPICIQGSPYDCVPEVNDYAP